MNPFELVSPAAMSPGARAAEITAILATALLRRQAATTVAEGVVARAVDLGLLPDQRVHTTPYQQEKL